MTMNRAHELSFERLVGTGREITRHIALAEREGDIRRVERLLRRKDRIHRLRSKLAGPWPPCVKKPALPGGGIAMARTRQIKPSFFLDEDLALCSREARLLFIGLWTIAIHESWVPKRAAR
jgi:hypothetical protein